MIRGQLLCIIIGLCGICASFSQEQEFIKQPKEKKICPSRQQHVELNAFIVDMANDLLHHINAMSQEVINLQKRALTEINGYMSSDKECMLNNATKKQRAEIYQKKEQIRAELPKMMEQLLKFKKKLQDLW